MIWKYLDSCETVQKMKNDLENPDSYDTVRKMGSDLEKPGWIWHHPENGKRSGKIRTVWKPYGKWEMIWTSPDSFETVRKKMGNDMAKIRTVCQVFVLYVQKLSRRAKTFWVAMLPCYQGFCASGWQKFSSKTVFLGQEMHYDMV